MMINAEYEGATPRERRAMWRAHKGKESPMKLALRIAMLLFCLGAGAFFALEASDVPPRGVMDGEE